MFIFVVVVLFLLKLISFILACIVLIIVSIHFWGWDEELSIFLKLLNTVSALLNSFFISLTTLLHKLGYPEAVESLEGMLDSLESQHATYTSTWRLMSTNQLNLQNTLFTKHQANSTKLLTTSQEPELVI